MRRLLLFIFGVFVFSSSCAYAVPMKIGVYVQASKFKTELSESLKSALDKAGYDCAVKDINELSAASFNEYDLIVSISRYMNLDINKHLKSVVTVLNESQKSRLVMLNTVGSSKHSQVYGVDAVSSASKIAAKDDLVDRIIAWISSK